MTQKQQLMNIALDLKRTVNYRLIKDNKKADYFFAEAKNAFNGLEIDISENKKSFVKLDGNLEEILMTSNLLESLV